MSVHTTLPDLPSHTRPTSGSRRVEQALADQLLNGSGMSMALWDRQARLLHCNDVFLASTGRTREAALGRTLTQLFGIAAWAEACNAFAAAWSGHAASYQRQRMRSLEDGRWERVQVRPATRGDADEEGVVVTVAFDIDREVLERQQIEQARRRLERFTDHIPYPLTYVDTGCVLRFVNRAYTLATGQPAHKLVGRHIGEVRGPRRWAEHRPYFERALKGEPVQYTRLTDLADRGLRWMRTSYVPDVDDDGRVVGLYTVTTDVHELTEAQERLRRGAERDALTDCYSRRTTLDRIESALLPGSPQPMALFWIDLDGIKLINDQHGQAAGDRLLCAAAQALQRAVRSDDTVGRLGGDEFVVLASVPDVASAHVLAQHLLQSVRECGSAGAAMGANIGYALAPIDANDPLRWQQLAEDAMLSAKRAGKNCVRRGQA